MKISYSILWSRLSLFRDTDDGRGNSGSVRIFTLWPRWVWWEMKDWHYGDPGKHCHDWLKRNRHWDDEDFHRAVCWYYANGSEPGHLARLNPKILS